MNNFDVIDFRFAEVTDKFDEKYIQIGAWSRPYEYLFVADFIRWNMLKSMDKPKIHNTSWGFEGIHITFRDDLDMIGECIHSDIVNSSYRKTYYYDITEEYKEFDYKFDFVLNVSTIEHLSTSEKRIVSIENLFKQVKQNGHLILTFDYPSVNLLEIETLMNSKCKPPIKVLNGKNSINPYENYYGLNVVYLILKKNG